MKTFLSELCGLSAAWLAATAASATVVQYDSGPLQQWIPDDTATGLASTIHIADVGMVTGLSLQLQLSVPAGQIGWLGDLYAYLRHDDGFAVLLNRPGRTDVSPFGYGDNQAVSLTLTDSAANGDVHGYRSTLGGSESTSLVGMLVGEWAPDGRAVDPAGVLDTTPRTALLGDFAGHNLAGNWTLFVADLSSGGQHQLDQWTMEFEVQAAAVPESDTTAAVICSGLFAFVCWRNWRRR